MAAIGGIAVITHGTHGKIFDGNLDPLSSCCSDKPVAIPGRGVVELWVVRTAEGSITGQRSGEFGTF